jgi:hypothetical protein
MPSAKKMIAALQKITLAESGFFTEFGRVDAGKNGHNNKASCF